MTEPTDRLASVARADAGPWIEEHAVHTWDVAVALDPGVEVAADAGALLVDTIGQLTTRAGKPYGRPRRLRVVTADSERLFVLETGEQITLGAAPPSEQSAPSQATVVLPAAALIRLVNGRLDAEHTPAVETRQVDLADLRQLFPGF